MPLQASADADIRELYWFAGGRFLGRSEAGKALLWRAVPGRTLVRVVDERGRSDARAVEVVYLDSAR